MDDLGPISGNLHITIVGSISTIVALYRIWQRPTTLSIKSRIVGVVPSIKGFQGNQSRKAMFLIAPKYGVDPVSLLFNAFKEFDT